MKCVQTAVDKNLVDQQEIQKGVVSKRDLVTHNEGLVSIILDK